MRGRRRTVLAVALLSVALARLVYLSEIRGHPLFDHPVVDARVHDDLALRIAEGDGYPFGVYASDPFYPYFLALFYRILGHSIFPVALAQLLLGVASSLLLFDLGRRVGGYGVGIFALLLGGLYAPVLFYEAFLLPTAVGVFVDLLLLAVLVRRRPGSSRLPLALAGCLLGLGTLIQGDRVLFLPFLFGWVVLTEPAGKRLGSVLVLLAGLALPIAPVTARNLVRGGDLVPVSSRAGIHFYMGNNEEARGAFTFPDEGIIVSPENVNVYDSKRIAEKTAGRSLKPSEVSSFWARKALAWIAGNPRDFLVLLGRKCALFWNDVEVPDNADFAYFREKIGILRLLPIGFGVLAPLGVFGAAVLARKRRATLPLLFLAAQFLSALVFFTHSRSRVPFALVLAVPAAAGLLVFARGMRRWSAAERLWASGLIALLFVLSNAPGFDSGKGIARASSLTHTAEALLAAGDPVGAEASYREALRLRPGHPTARFGVGRLLEGKGAKTEAAAEYLAAIEAAPAFAEAHANLGSVYHEMGDLEKAEAELREAVRLRTEWAGPRYNLANVLFDLGRYEEAAEQYRLAARFAPRDPLIARNWSNAAEKAGDLAGAERVVREWLEQSGENADLRNRLGDLLEKLGREEEAMEEYERAVALDPRHSAAWNNIGLLRYHGGETDAAIQAWRKILAYDPASPVIDNIRSAEALETEGEGD